MAEVKGDAADESDVEARSLACKDEGNKFFKEGLLRQAVEAYTRGIALKPSPALYSNRAACNLKMEQFGLVIADADAAIKMERTYFKAYYRKGSALLGIGRNKQALRSFKAVCKLKPKSKDARAKMTACQKLVSRERFAAALKQDEKPRLSETIDATQFSVGASYDGPALGEDGEVTPEFVVAMMAHFKAQKTLHKKYVVQMLLKMVNLLKSLPTLVHMSLGTPAEEAVEGGDGKVGQAEKERKFTVCGDTHGQYYDLLNIFEINGNPSPSNPYLFNGDYVDRGSFSFENVMTLFAWKLCYPNALHLNRGNHESKNMNKMYGFEGEVVAKYDAQVMELFTEVFNWLPLAAVVEKKVFVCHGGLFQQDGVTLDDIRKTSRNSEPPEKGIMCDIMWSDPSPFPGRSPSKRGVGLAFGPDITKAFLDLNNLELVVRSHEVKEEGYLVEHDGKLVTLFSAPNYCDQMGNKGAMLIFKDTDMKPTFVQYTAVPHPPVRAMAYAPRMWGM